MRNLAGRVGLHNISTTTVGTGEGEEEYRSSCSDISSQASLRIDGYSDPRYYDEGGRRPETTRRPEATRGTITGEERVNSMALIGMH